MYDMPLRRCVLKKMGFSQPTLTIQDRSKILFPSLKFLVATGTHYSLQNLQRGSREIQQEPAKDENTCVVLSCFSHIQLFAILWTIAHQALLSVGFPRQEYWSELPCPPPGDLPNPGIEPTSLMSPPFAGTFFTAEPLQCNLILI